MDKITEYDPDKHVTIKCYNDRAEAEAALTAIKEYLLFCDYGGSLVTTSENGIVKHRLVLVKQARQFGTSWYKMLDTLGDFMRGWHAGKKASMAEIRKNPRWDPVVEHFKPNRYDDERDEYVILEAPDGSIHSLRRHAHLVQVFNVGTGNHEWIREKQWNCRQDTDAKGHSLTWGPNPVKEVDLPQKVKGMRSAVKAYLKIYAQRCEAEKEGADV